MVASRLLAAALCGLVCAACGEDGETQAARTATPEATPTASPRPEVPEDPARSDEECLELWNTLQKIGTAGQQSPADALGDLAEGGRVRAAMRFVDGEGCGLVAADPARRNQALYFVAADGRGPWSMPAPLDLKREFGNRRPVYNATATRDGLLRPAG